MKLLIKDDSGKTTTVQMARDEITIGRKDGNTIRLTEKNVSRTHARFIKRGEEIHIEDLSRYGTRVNGERITETRRVGAGDTIVIGDYVLSLEGVKAVEEVPKAAPAPVAAAPIDPAQAKKKAEMDAAARERILAAKREMEEDAPASVKADAKKDAKKDAKGDPKKDAKPADETRQSRGAGKKRIGATHPTLVAVTTHLAGTEFPVTTETAILGRTGENDIKVDHHSISRNHAKVVVKDGQVRMVDLQSKNGIRVNGEFWEESILKSGDIIELGKVQFRFVAKGEEFVYRPEDYAEAAPVEELKPAGGSKTWLVLLLLIAAGGLAALYFLVIAKPTPVDNVKVPPTATTPAPAPTPDPGSAVTPPTPDPSAATAPKPDPTAAVAPTPPTPTDKPGTVEPTPPTTPPEVPPAPVDHTETIKGHMAAASTAMTDRKWEEAEAEAKKVLALAADHTEAQALLARATSEKNVLAALTAARDASGRGDRKSAWGELQKLQSIPADSAYVAEVAELRTTVSQAIANGLIDDAKQAHTRKNWNDAIAKAEEALTYVPNHAEAPDVIAKARRARAEQAAREAKEAAKDPARPKDPAKPKDPPPAAEGKSGEELYKEARGLHAAKDLAGALKLYEQAAAKGYATSHKMIGSVKIERGDVPGAIAAYKRYLQLVPSARDADTVRDIIIRLGGTP